MLNRSIRIAKIWKLASLAQINTQSNNVTLIIYMCPQKRKFSLDKTHLEVSKWYNTNSIYWKFLSSKLLMIKTTICWVSLMDSEIDPLV